MHVLTYCDIQGRPLNRQMMLPGGRQDVCCIAISRMSDVHRTHIRMASHRCGLSKNVSEWLSHEETVEMGYFTF